MILANENTVGQLIGDGDYRKQWVELVRELQLASEVSGGALDGWVFHGTDVAAADRIAIEGLIPSYAILHDGRDWVHDSAVHFGTANVAAFFAEDLIESTEDPFLKLVIFGARLEDIALCGVLGTDGQMVDCPLYSRLRRPESEVMGLLDKSGITSWNECFDVLETVTVRGVVPSAYLHRFERAADLKELIAKKNSPTKHCAPNI